MSGTASSDGRRKLVLLISLLPSFTTNFSSSSSLCRQTGRVNVTQNESRVSSHSFILRVRKAGKKDSTLRFFLLSSIRNHSIPFFSAPNGTYLFRSLLRIFLKNSFSPLCVCVWYAGREKQLQLASILTNVWLFFSGSLSLSAHTRACTKKKKESRMWREKETLSCH